MRWMPGTSKTAFEWAVGDCLDDLYRYAYWLCRDRWQAEDLAQETALRGLGEDSRHALLLQVLGGFTCAEVAALFGSTEGAVMTRLTRARQALRRTLEPGQAAKEAKEG